MIAVATKSGTNFFQWHVLETDKTSAFSATPWVYNFLGNPKDHFVNNTYRFSNVSPGEAGQEKSTVFHQQPFESLQERFSGRDWSNGSHFAAAGGRDPKRPLVIYDPLTTRPQRLGFCPHSLRGQPLPLSHLVHPRPI